jgi:hypothetical protein
VIQFTGGHHQLEPIDRFALNLFWRAAGDSLYVGVLPGARRIASPATSLQKRVFAII